MTAKKRRVLSVDVKDSLMLGVLDFLSMHDIEVKSMGSAVSSFIAFHINLYRTAETLPIYKEEDTKTELADRIQLVGRMIAERANLARPKESFETHPSIGNKDRGLQSLRDVIHTNAVAETDMDFAPHLMGGNSFCSEFELKDSENTDLDRILQRAKTLSTEDHYPSQGPALSFDALDELLHLEIEEQELLAEADLLSKIMVGSVDVKPSMPVSKVEHKMLEKSDPRLVKDKMYKRFIASEDQISQIATRILYYHLPDSHWSTEKAETMLVSIIESISKGL